MVRILIAAALVIVGGFGACALIPERYAVNAPLGNLLFGSGRGTPPQQEVSSRMRALEGFSISIWADELPNARFLRFTPDGDLLVSQPRSSRIALLERDADGDGLSDGRRTLLEGLNQPHGIDLWDGWLYVGETDAVARIRFDPATRSVSGDLERVVTGLPAGGNHWTRTVRFGPDGWLYVSIGSSCNVCLEEDERRAAILRFRPDGSEGAIHASGLRNSVGFDWQPGTDALYATDNGRDLLGDDFPPEELNRIEAGGFYGWPFANGDRVPDPDFGPGREDEIASSLAPAYGFRAHNAPLGITFVRGEAPDGLEGAALVALHGSWNRSEKDGYKVVSLHWDDDGRIEERDFATGFLEDEDVIGRPVDVAQGPSGGFYISDDYAGVVWRVARGAAPQAAAQAGGSAAGNGGGPLADWSAEERARARTAGHALWEQHECYACHDAERAEPGVVAKPLERLASRFDVDGLAAALQTPTPPMPVFSLDDAERRDLAVYLLDLEESTPGP